MHDLGNVEAWRGEKRIRGEPHGSTSLKRWDSKRLYWSVTAPAQPQFKPIYQAQTQLAIHSTFDGSMILFEKCCSSTAQVGVDSGCAASLPS
jgi:hypothetical protein